MSSVAKPPDLAIDEMKKLCRIRWPTIEVGHGARVVELEDEVARSPRRRSSRANVTSVSFTCSDQRCGRAQVARERVDHREADRAEA